MQLFLKDRRGLTTGSHTSPEERSANARADDECPDSGGDYDAMLDGYGGDCEIPHLGHAGGAHHGYGRVRVRMVRASVYARAAL